MMTSKEIAQILGVTRPTIDNWAGKGQIPSDGGPGRRLYDLDAVCDALGIDPDEARPWGGARRARKAEIRRAREAGAKPERRGYKISPDRNWFNQCLHRIVKGDLGIGDTAAQLSTLTGIPYIGIRERIDDVEFIYSDEEKSGRLESELTTDELKTLIPRYNKSKDPAVQAWVASLRKPKT